MEPVHVLPLVLVQFELGGLHPVLVDLATGLRMVVKAGVGPANAEALVEKQLVIGEHDLVRLEAH